MQLAQLEATLRDRADKLADGIILLCQIPLLEAEYQDAFPAFQGQLSDRDGAERLAAKFPLVFSRVTSELTSRSFTPREAIDQRGVGLWENFHAHLRQGAPPGHVIGSLFRGAVINLRQHCPYLFWQENSGPWRYVGPLLIHAGLPVQSVAAVVEALRLLIRWEDWQIARLTHAQIERPLREQRGLSTYTKRVLTETKEGELLVRQFLRLARFLREGGIMPAAGSFSFSEPFVQELREALSRDPWQPTSRAHAWTARLVWNPDSRFIGWIVPARGPWAGASGWVFTAGRERREAAVHTEGEEIWIGTGPQEWLMELVPSGGAGATHRLPKPAADLPDLLLFHGLTGEFMPWPQLVRDGLLCGEYLALCRRGQNAAELFTPGGAAEVTEQGVPVPGGPWVRRYAGIRLQINADPSAVVTVRLGENQTVRIEVQGGAVDRVGTVTLEGGRPAHLWSRHPALVGERIPVFMSGRLPGIRFWGKVYAQSPPLIRLLQWRQDRWVPVRRIEPKVEHERYSSLIRLAGEDIRQIQEEGRPALFRLELYDLTLHGEALEPLHLLWFPGARAEVCAGLADPGEPGRMALALPFGYLARATSGRLYVRHLGGGTQLVHRLPPAGRAGRMTLHLDRDRALGPILLEWGAPGVLAASALEAAQDKGEVLPFAPPPLADVELDERAACRGSRAVTAWWPALTVPLVLRPADRPFANLSFDGQGLASVHLGELLDAAAPLAADTGRADAALMVGPTAWPLISVRSDARLAELERTLRRGRQPDPIELARLLWACDLLLSGRAAPGAGAAPARLLLALKELSAEMPAARLMEARLSRWLRMHPQFGA